MSKRRVIPVTSVSAVGCGPRGESQDCLQVTGRRQPDELENRRSYRDSSNVTCVQSSFEDSYQL